MIGRTNRFHGYNSLKQVYKHGKTARSPQLSLRFSLRPGKSYRVAVVVSKKVSKSAVVRNRIRRRIYETVRRNETIPPATDLVFTVFSDRLLELTPTQLAAAVQGLLKKSADVPSTR